MTVDITGYSSCWILISKFLNSKTLLKSLVLVNRHLYTCLVKGARVHNFLTYQQKGFDIRYPCITEEQQKSLYHVLSVFYCSPPFSFFSEVSPFTTTKTNLFLMSICAYMKSSTLQLAYFLTHFSSFQWTNLRYLSFGFENSYHDLQGVNIGTLVRQCVSLEHIHARLKYETTTHQQVNQDLMCTLSIPTLKIFRCVVLPYNVTTTNMELNPSFQDKFILSSQLRIFSLASSDVDHSEFFCWMVENRDQLLCLESFNCQSMYERITHRRRIQEISEMQVLLEYPCQFKSLQNLDICLSSLTSSIYQGFQYWASSLQVLRLTFIVDPSLDFCLGLQSLTCLHSLTLNAMQAGICPKISPSMPLHVRNALSHFRHLRLFILGGFTLCQEDMKAIEQLYALRILSLMECALDIVCVRLLYDCFRKHSTIEEWIMLICSIKTIEPYSHDDLLSWFKYETDGENAPGQFPLIDFELLKVDLLEPFNIKCNQLIKR
ncbi:MAG: hypothetical protein Sylvanvirus4_5 [Sylvanvirus sp.]|uniref:Uncharacterized protein n=1 Tax=Sylvanvirus sp. TaxID=2487774 RepID=A0A3G5AJH9_9VIRU|nr:MAG: hypothetical protein Sylvanvirus4_5 [Sylvanvirus sp.]